MKPAAGLLHALAAKTLALGAGQFALQGADEVGAVQVAAGLAGAEEDARGSTRHGSLPAAVRWVIPGRGEDNSAARAGATAVSRLRQHGQAGQRGRLLDA